MCSQIYTVEDRRSSVFDLGVWIKVVAIAISPIGHEIELMAGGSEVFELPIPNLEIRNGDRRQKLATQQDNDCNRKKTKQEDEEDGVSVGTDAESFYLFRNLAKERGAHALEHGDSEHGQQYRKDTHRAANQTQEGRGYRVVNQAETMEQNRFQNCQVSDLMEVEGKEHHMEEEAATAARQLKIIENHWNPLIPFRFPDEKRTNRLKEVAKKDRGKLASNPEVDMAIERFRAWAEGEGEAISENGQDDRHRRMEVHSYIGGNPGRTGCKPDRWNVVYGYRQKFEPRAQRSTLRDITTNSVAVKTARSSPFSKLDPEQPSAVISHPDNG
ncbi:hypothetical protein B0H34DRAFT_806061 [Crassisporium funariophilum]|nr:hypothetical protein B0H34DRAFT_806061 [Crassisporium funariophilum]